MLPSYVIIFNDIEYLLSIVSLFYCCIVSIYGVRTSRFYVFSSIRQIQNILRYLFKQERFAGTVYI